MIIETVKESLTKKEIVKKSEVLTTSDVNNNFQTSSCCNEGGDEGMPTPHSMQHTATNTLNFTNLKLKLDDKYTEELPSS